MFYYTSDTAVSVNIKNRALFPVSVSAGGKTAGGRADFWNPAEFCYVCTGCGREIEGDAISAVSRTFGEYRCFTYFEYVL